MWQSLPGEPVDQVIDSLKVDGMLTQPSQSLAVWSDEDAARRDTGTFASLLG